MQFHRGFLLVTVLFVLLIVSILGAVLLSSTMQNIQYVKHEKEILQAEETARSGLAYYKAYGIPPLVNGKPQTLSDKLSTGSIYLVKANLNFLIGETSSKITVEQFSSLYHSDSFHTFSFMDHHLIEQDYPAFNTFSLTQAPENPCHIFIPISSLLLENKKAVNPQST